MSPRYAAADLIDLSTALFIKAGLAPERAAVLAEVFLEADLMGFSTHGMHRVPHNLQWLLDGESRAVGDPLVLADRGALFNWDADFLPGPWVLQQAVEEGLARLPEHGVVTATIRRSQHIACLAAYLPKVVEAGYAAIITCSTPGQNTVSAFGGIDPLFSVNPIAMAAPGEEFPLLFDISMAITAGGYVSRAEREGKQLPEPCLKDRQGNVTTDPRALSEGGSIMPIGGAAHGYKGAALSIMTEVLTMALGGYGRADAAAQGDDEANSVFLQLIDPAAFSSLEGFKQQLRALQDLVEGSAVAEGAAELRFPGRRAWQRRSSQLAEGVALYPTIMEDIKPWAERFELPLPAAL
ncbi:Ldh family oxidoreductase [Parahaliea sp. F7430]|uniref:Ldh family oxidoreductase n=1 Tax=Sediminihaliea albiluteola TaxID=2758564 RepID=A0A7W2TYD0_9GAMM|nr:Ldh family oxidoreductase [Sediminihaliea albiluteola]MBA6414191.1 Ldh family oxidoreductase [Sediminihaliea albiluteola]